MPDWTDEQLRQAYLAATGDGHLVSQDDDEVTDALEEVRAVCSAETAEAGAGLIEWWDCCDGMAGYVNLARKMRAALGIEDGPGNAVLILTPDDWECDAYCVHAGQCRWTPGGSDAIEIFRFGVDNVSSRVSMFCDAFVEMVDDGGD